MKARNGIIRESIIISPLPKLCCGGFLEKKLWKGKQKLCLRRPDTIIARAANEFELIREWEPPFIDEWDESFYEKRGES